MLPKIYLMPKVTLRVNNQLKYYPKYMVTDLFVTLVHFTYSLFPLIFRSDPPALGTHSRRHDICTKNQNENQKLLTATQQV